MPIVIGPQNATVAENALKKQDLPTPRDLARTEFGSIEGQVIQTTTYYGHPSVRIRERITGAEALCVFSDVLAERVGVERNWRDVWRERRVLVTGEILYRSDGTIVRVQASDIVAVDAPQLDYADIADPNFTGGLSPSAYVDALWEEEVG